MKLSEAILLGRVTVANVRANDINACAITMAVRATGDVPNNCAPDRRYSILRERWPWTDDEFDGATLKCPWCPRQLTGPAFIYHPFDIHVMSGRITLEQLCDWIRTIEPSDEPADAAVTREREAEAVETSDRG